MDNGPWCFNGYLVAMKRWEPDVAPNEVLFLEMPIWIQLRGLPFEWCSVPVLTKLGDKIGRVLDVKPGYCGKHANNISRIRVCLSLSKPILPGLWASRKGKDPLWLNFKYERLPHLCYSCGIISHETKFCSKADLALDSSLNPFGDWLRVDSNLKTPESVQKGLLIASSHDNNLPTLVAMTLVPYSASTVNLPN